MISEKETVPRDSKILLDYLKELLTDRINLAKSSGPYIHIGKLLEKEILKIRVALLSDYGICTISENDLPEPEGPTVNLQTKIYVPVDPNKSFNFVGRILGPEGSTAKCLQQCLGVKIMIRGRGSMRDRKKEEANMGRPNWEHLNDNLHILITTEDYENRAKARLNKASEYISLFLKESLNGSEKEDKVKQMQLIELSIRKELRSNPWHLNFNDLSEFGFPSKSNTVLPNVGSMNFSFGCSSSPFYPSLQYNQHYGPYPPQYQHHTMGNASRPGHLGTMSPSTASGLSAALIFSNGVGPYPDPFSPNSHQSPTGQTIQSALTVPPVNYWSNTSSLSHLSPNYPMPSAYSHQIGDGETQNSHEHFASDNVITSNYTTTDGSTVSCDVVDPAHPSANTTFASGHQSSQQLPRIHEENVDDPLIKKFGSCDPTLNKTKYTHSQTDSSLAMNASKSLHISSLSESKLGTRNNAKRRYSQKHNSQLATKDSSPANRTKPVVVKVGTKDQNILVPKDLVTLDQSNLSQEREQTNDDSASVDLNLIPDIKHADLPKKENFPKCSEKSQDVPTEDTEWINKDVDSVSKDHPQKPCSDETIPGNKDSSMPLSLVPDATTSHFSNKDVSTSADDSEQDNKVSYTNETI